MQRKTLEEYLRALVIIYVKCYELNEARGFLDMHRSNNNVVSWIALIVGYAREGHNQIALDCFEIMQHEGTLVDAMTYECLLEA